MSAYKESTYDRVGQDGDDNHEGISRMTNDEWFKSHGMKAMSETISNSRLLAAAPELLEALKELSQLDVKGHALIDRLQFSETGRLLAKKITQAIQKAEGES